MSPPPTTHHKKVEAVVEWIIVGRREKIQMMGKKLHNEPIGTSDGLKHKEGPLISMQ